MIIPIRRLLVANRSEIAIRIFRAASEMGIRTFAVYAEQDKLSLHRFKADEAYRIGRGKGPIEAYLSIDEVIRVAKEHRIDAIHPGYGFLSESPEFANACTQAGIAFIGPSEHTMRTLGNKIAARNLASSCGVTVMPGDLVVGDREGVYFIPPQYVQEVLDKADEVHVHDEWTKKKFDEGKYKSSEIYGSPTDPKLKQEYKEYLKKRLEEIQKHRSPK